MAQLKIQIIAILATSFLVNRQPTFNRLSWSSLWALLPLAPASVFSTDIAKEDLQDVAVAHDERMAPVDQEANQESLHAPNSSNTRKVRCVTRLSQIVMRMAMGIMSRSALPDRHNIVQCEALAELISSSCSLTLYRARRGQSTMMMKVTTSPTMKSLVKRIIRKMLRSEVAALNTTMNLSLRKRHQPLKKIEDNSRNDKENLCLIT